ncbi:hypothetical protein APASM_5527 [Actinosynnema pretiosum subsp. pretiosum]|nr:hypothetical protein APASM_5527 [Actinosynnema pretiosum subsp. pretiosum]
MVTQQVAQRCGHGGTVDRWGWPGGKGAGGCGRAPLAG